jgi:hypothetical protein
MQFFYYQTVKIETYVPVRVLSFIYLKSSTGIFFIKLSRCKICHHELLFSGSSVGCHVIAAHKMSFIEYKSQYLQFRERRKRSSSAGMDLNSMGDHHSTNNDFDGGSRNHRRSSSGGGGSKTRWCAQWYNGASYACIVCSFRTHVRTRMTKHVRAEHPERLSTKRTGATDGVFETTFGRFRCEFCGEEICHNKTEIVRHLECHAMDLDTYRRLYLPSSSVVVTGAGGSGEAVIMSRRKPPPPPPSASQKSSAAAAAAATSSAVAYQPLATATSSSLAHRTTVVRRQSDDGGSGSEQHAAAVQNNSSLLAGQQHHLVRSNGPATSMPGWGMDESRGLGNSLDHHLQRQPQPPPPSLLGRGLYILFRKSYLSPLPPLFRIFYFTFSPSREIVGK